MNLFDRLRPYRNYKVLKHYGLEKQYASSLRPYRNYKVLKLIPGINAGACGLRPYRNYKVLKLKSTGTKSMIV